MNIKKLTSILAFAAIIFFVGCKDDDDKTTPGTNPNTEENPTVNATSPADNADDVALNKTVSVAFDQSMDASSFNNNSFTLKQGSSTVIGTVSYTGFTATFNPGTALTDNTTYTATITKDVKNASGKALASDVMWTFTTGTNATGMSTVDLGSADNYVILAKSAINNSPTSAITGDIGLSPAEATYITGFSLENAIGYANSDQISGRAYASDMLEPTPTILTAAVDDMILAYNDASGRSNPDFNELESGDIGDKTLMPGLYKWSNTVNASKNLIISGSSSDIWIFQITGDLTIGSGVTITLSGGARAENIFWQVDGEVSLGSTSNFNGIILSNNGITLKKDAMLKGRALAQTAVILDENTVTQP